MNTFCPHADRRASTAGYFVRMSDARVLHIWPDAEDGIVVSEIGGVPQAIGALPAAARQVPLTADTTPILLRLWRTYVRIRGVRR